MIFFYLENSGKQTASKSNGGIPYLIFRRKELKLLNLLTLNTIIQRLFYSLTQQRSEHHDETCAQVHVDRFHVRYLR